MGAAWAGQGENSVRADSKTTAATGGGAAGDASATETRGGVASGMAVGGEKQPPRVVRG